MTEAAILSTSIKTPGRIVPNRELEERLGLKEGVIERMTGIRERHYLGPGESLQGIAAAACVEAIRRSRLDPADLDMMIYYTDVPPTLPADSGRRKTYYEVGPHIQHLLTGQGIALGCECINIGGSCVGFISSLQIACALVKSGIKRNVLIVGAADCSSFLARAETNVVMTFADGAAATIVSAAREQGFLDFCCMTDPSGWDSGCFRDYEEMYVDRKRVAEFAPQAFATALRRLLETAHLDRESIDLVIPHQAGSKILDRAIELARIPHEKVYLCLQCDGNAGAPALQIALTHAVEEGRIHEGDLVALIGFGTGWHYGATAFRHHDGPNG